ncbi:FAD-binding domain-containing protein [Fragilaria crotonensis]|nr:FAD-binding domain-containing protein [Fragilaria crotonensis]
MDRDPRQLVDSFKNNQTCGRVVVLGDAVHSMSPFKGAGANQALLDGPLLASWLQRASLPSAIKGFHREMANRTQPRVLASRKAAAFLHSPEVMLVETTGQDFAGVMKDRVPELLQKLQDDRVGAQLGAALDSRVNEVVDGLCCRETCNEDNSKKDVSSTLMLAQSQALMFASQGNTQGLRTLSLTCPAAVLYARDPVGRTCLHLSAQLGHYHTCKWLLTEVFLAPGIEDDYGITALQIAGDNEEIVNLIETVLAKIQLVS